MGKAKLKVVLLRATPDADELTAMAARLCCSARIMSASRSTASLSARLLMGLSR